MSDRDRDNRFTPPCLGERGRCTEQRAKPKASSLAQPEFAELGRADASGIRQHGVEYRLQLDRSNC